MSEEVVESARVEPEVEEEEVPDQTLPLEPEIPHSAILVFGDVQDLIPMRSDTAQGWIDNLKEWNGGADVANWYIGVGGERLQGAGWDMSVRWGNPDHPYDTYNSRYVMFLGAPDEWDEAAEVTAREIIDRHTELYGATRIATHIDLDESSIRGRDCAMRNWVNSGALPRPKEEEEEVALPPEEQVPLLEMSEDLSEVPQVETTEADSST